MFNRIDSTLDLINFPTLAVGPVAPLVAIYRPQVTPFFSKCMVGGNLVDEFFHACTPLRGECLFRGHFLPSGFLDVVAVGPFVPYIYLVLYERFNIAAAA